ncbi:hypothetical protein BC332_03672 [Capsicum chinense]|nr:hypothetical protein BC332_03672 [Capsicum chinense]
MVQGSRQRHEKLPFALLGYRTTVRTSTRVTPYLLVYGTEAVIPAEVEILSLRVIIEAEIDDDEWIKTRQEHLSFIEKKRLTSVCHGQLYQRRMAQAYNKKVCPRNFEVGQLVLRCILLHQVEAKDKFSPNWKEELDGEPWFLDIKRYIQSGEYPSYATNDKKRTIRRFASGFFLSGGILYKRTPDLGLLRCVDVKEASAIIVEIHFGVCGSHMNGHVLSKKILQAGYYWLTMERDSIQFVRKCHQCQVHGDLIRSPPVVLHAIAAP